MANTTTPIPQDKIEETFVWRDWFQRLSNKVSTLTPQPSDAGKYLTTDGYTTYWSSVTTSGSTSGGGTSSGVTQIVAGANVTISPIGGTGAVTINASGGSGSYTAPVTKTTDFTLTVPTAWVINNKSGSTCTVTLPSASSYTGYTITFQNYQAQLLESVTSNVCPIGSGVPGTAILTNAAGSWATMVSDGTNWIIMQQAGSTVTVTSDLLMENGSYILLENGSKIILD